MTLSAASSRSAVVTPSRTLPSSSRSVRTRTAPAAAIRSISSGDFLMITTARRGRASELVLQAQRGDRGPDVIVDLGRAARPIEALEEVALLVEADERRRLAVVDGQALADGLLAVVLALDQARAVLVADLVVLGRVGVDVVDVLGLRAYPPARQAADDLVVG